jgi:LPXTG-motif cell wall-anchored protein
MKWLAQRQRERRWWTASASVAICGLVLGVIGIVPAFADLQAASCEAMEADGSVTVSWNDVPEGLALTVLAQDASGGLSPVASDSSVAGFGPTGSWTGDAYPGAVAYLIHGDPADGGGTLRCADPVADAPVEVPVTNAVGATNPGFTAGTCPNSSTGETYGWAFVAPGAGMVIESLRVEFASAGTVTFFIPGSSGAQAYMFTPGPDEIVNATATVSGADTDQVTVELVFVCSPDDAPEPDPTPTSPPQPDATPEPDPTTEPPADDGGADDGTADDDGGQPSDGNPPSVGTTPRIEASLGVDCTSEAVVVELRNLGDVTGVAEIVADGVIVEVATVEPGRTRTVSVQVPLVATTVEVFVGGVVVAATTLADPCTNEYPEVEASVTVDCVADTITVTLDNTGNRLGIVTVDIGGDTTRVEVMPGTTETVTADRDGRSEVPVSVSTDGVTILSTTVDASCDEPSPELSAQAALVCDAATSSVRVVVTNTGDAPGSVVVDIDGSQTRIDVAAGATESTTIAIPGDGAVTVVVRDAGGEILAQLTDQAPCESPEPELDAKAALDCAAGKIRVTVTNTGDADGVATVQVGDTTQTVVVAADGESVVHVYVAAGTTVRVRVNDGQRSLLDQTFSDVCETPAPALRASVARDCGSDTVRVVVTNDGDAAAGATITYGARTTTVRVAAGSSVTENFPLADVTQTVRVTGPDAAQTIIVEAQIEPCDEGAPRLRAEGQVDCQLGEIVLSIFNDGDAAGTVTWAINGRSETAVVAPGTSLVVSQPVIVGATNVWSVTSGGQTIAGGELVDACRPATPSIDAELVIDCGNDEIVVRVSNSGAVAGSARVVINGEVSDVAVPAGDVVVVRGDLPSDGSYLVDVSSDGTSVLTEQGTATECLLPPDEGLVASVAFSCRWDEAVVRVENPSSEQREVTITVDGDAETVAIGGGDDIEVAYPLEEDEPYEITVVDEDGQSLAFARGVHDCVDVGGTTITNPNPPTTVTTTTPIRLPNTGANSGLLAGAGLVFIAAGLVAVRASQFRRDRIATA